MFMIVSCPRYESAGQLQPRTAECCQSLRPSAGLAENDLKEKTKNFVSHKTVCTTQSAKISPSIFWFRSAANFNVLSLHPSNTHVPHFLYITVFFYSPAHSSLFSTGELVHFHYTKLQYCHKKLATKTPKGSNDHSGILENIYAPWGRSMRSVATM